MTSKIASHDNKTNVVLQNLQMYVPLARQGQSMAFVFSPFTFYHLVDELCNNFMSVWYYVSLGIYYVHTERLLYALYEPAHGKTGCGRPRTNYINYIQKVTGHQLPTD